jgi:hypothetical protein
MIATLRFHDGRVMGTLALVGGVARPDAKMSAFLAEINVVDPIHRELLTYADGERYIWALQAMLENGYYAMEVKN